MQNIQFHEIANIFPLIQGKEFVDLKEDIKKNGLLEPIWMYQDKILDGRNRFRACQETGANPEFREYTEGDPLGFVLSLNLMRRHLNESQRAKVAANIANLEAHRPKNNTANLQSLTRKAAAEKLNVSERTVNTAKKVQRAIDDARGIAEINTMIDNGVLAISAASEIISHPIEKQMSICNKLKSGEAKNVKQATRQIDHEERVSVCVEINDPNIDLKHGNCLDLIEELTEKPDLVITDPPYGIEVHSTRRGGKDYADGEDYALDLIDVLCGRLVEKCADNAHLYFFSGYTHAFAFKQILKKYFDVQDNPIIWVKDNHTMCDFSKNYPSKHEYIWFCKQKGSNKKLTNCIADVITCKRERSTTHSAEKPTELLKILIEQSSVIGDLVFDPFLGSGSTGVAAKDNKRSFVGFELNSEWFEIAKSRHV